MKCVGETVKKNAIIEPDEKILQVLEKIFIADPKERIRPSKIIEILN